MTDIKAYIKSKREGLADSSITTYASILKSLYKKVWGNETMDFAKFSDFKPITEALKDTPPNKRKTILSALFIITEIPQYRSLMMEDSQAYAKEISKNKKTETQEENWVETADVESVLAKLEKDATAIYKKQTKTPQDLQEIQNYIIMVLLSGKYIPVRRSKDFCDFKIKKIDTEKDNYMLKNVLIFNSYKTSKTYGQQKVTVPRKLSMILKKWISRNPTDYLFFDKNSNPLTNVKLNQRLNKLFGKKSSVNALRHTFLTDKYLEHSEKDKELKKDTEEMGTSPYQAIHTYIKE
jgi:hypothetical protein